MRFSILNWLVEIGCFHLITRGKSFLTAQKAFIDNLNDAKLSLLGMLWNISGII